MLTSCGHYKSKYAYRFGTDGLIYFAHNDKLYTGTVLDTADVIIQFQVVNGKKNGLFKTSYLDGQIEKSGYVYNNDNEGEWKYYYPDGQIESEGYFNNNLPEGNWISYYENGNKKSEGKYMKGQQHGVWIYYDKNGNITLEIIYDTGDFKDLVKRVS
jgi:antitoxin component YwqK of YwqJK toxin-antitoxin module